MEQPTEELLGVQISPSRIAAARAIYSTTKWIVAGGFLYCLLRVGMWEPYLYCTLFIGQLIFYLLARSLRSMKSLFRLSGILLIFGITLCLLAPVVAPGIIRVFSRWG